MAKWENKISPVVSECCIQEKNAKCNIHLHKGEDGLTIISSVNGIFEVIIISGGVASHQEPKNKLFEQIFLEKATELPDEVKKFFGGCFGIK